MKTILITGGAGFIGSTFTRYLYHNYPDYRLIVVDCLTYAGDIENLPVSASHGSNGRFAFWYGNITNGELMDSLVAQADIVVHFAAETHVTRSIYDNTQFFMTDVIGTQTVCNAISHHRDRIERFVHISTSEVYGTALGKAIDEEHPLKPLSPYASAKAGADRLVYSYWRTYDIPAVIVRPFNNYGPYQHLEKVVPRFITSVMLGEKLRVHGDGQSARDFVFAEDNCRAIDLLVHAPADRVVGEVFNVGSGEHRSIQSLAEDVLDAMLGERDTRIEHVGDRPGQVTRHTADIAKIRERVGWEPATSWNAGLKRTINWYQQNRPWWEKQLWMREIPIITADGKRELH